MFTSVMTLLWATILTLSLDEVRLSEQKPGCRIWIWVIAITDKSFARKARFA